MEELKRNKPVVSVLIPTRNNEKDLIDCLDSIGHLDYPLDKLEIIIWDNNSRQESKDKVKFFLSSMRNEKPIQVELIEHDDNYGVYTSRDGLFKQLNRQAQFVLSIDDDVILPSNIFTELIPLFERNDSIGIIGPDSLL